MNSFESCRELERTSREQLRVHLFPQLAFDGRWVLIDKGSMAKEFQATEGDYVVNSDNETAWRIEHKSEYFDEYGNFFIETFSNLPAGNPGWFWKLNADFLLYHFLRNGSVYLLRLAALRAWLYSGDTPTCHRYRHRPQSQNEQRNITTGYCVRIADVEKAIEVRTWQVPQIFIDEYELRLERKRIARSGGQQEMRV